MQKWRKGLERDVSEKCVFEIDQSCEAEEVTLSEEECKSVREFLDAHEKEPDKDLAVNVGSELWTWGPPSWLVLEAARERYREFVGRHRNDAAIRKLRTNEALQHVPIIVGQ